jgi:hypothetical protein
MDDADRDPNRAADGSGIKYNFSLDFKENEPTVLKLDGLVVSKS